MNSSTSSSKTRNPKNGSLRLVALILLGFFGALEGFTRFELFHISKDLRRFETYPRRAAQLAKTPGLRVAFLGNSATERSIDTARLEKELAARGIAISSALFVADASHLNSWQPMANHLFWSPGHAPDVLVVPFFHTSLEDQKEMEIGRLAQFFTSRRELPGTLRELPDTGARLEFALSSVWATYAARDRLKGRVLNVILPDYQGFTQNLHQSNQREDLAHLPGTYRNLSRLVQQARAHNCRVCFVALPLRDGSYPIEAKLISHVRDAGAQLLDLRRVPGLNSRFYADSIHLGPQGRALFTPQLAQALAPLLRHTS